MNPKFERKEFVTALIKLVYRTIAQGMNDEASDILAGIRTLRPKVAELDMIDGWISFRRGAYRECIQRVRTLENHPEQWGSAKAMIANCQYMLGDRTWEMTLNELEQGNAGPDALELVSGLVINRARAAGTFQETTEAPKPAEAASVSAFQMPFMFMRA
ncbi:HrpB1 family type III secretion system apparatus protein [Acidovorax sp. SUPP2522]|uniref:HrpB1 family type III secretion system apparatus protein n=1 Tax=unclassified Acidovorax TaxID=2684926 RepID=UPI00234A3C60|nr:MULTISPECIES: HrpB1 family type III secretion system apparatus protein [Comamonadaceae]WCM97308.1 HrpB1 family type III secretion system apparatus protein [Acidovorax sp. GBBC 1281]WOI44547.1 HrpB1 family type III secretion system apparatus protein [Paracidovorax avenae]GKT18775.1 HrpB1 family type III secretion system apparatus protein [Acidovorax sp. SUPP2522]